MMKFKINNNNIKKINKKKKIIKSNFNKTNKNKKKVNNLMHKKEKNESTGILLNSSKHPKSKKNIFITNNYIQTINIKSPTEQIIDNKYQLNLLNLNIQEFDYEEAIIYDQRSYIKIYWSFLNDSQIILDIFFNKTNLDLLVIKLSFLVLLFK